MPPTRTLGDCRSSLLVCDDCGAVMERTGAAGKPHREADPDDLAPHYMPHADARATATGAGWNEEGTDRWSCPPCSSRRSGAG